MENSRLRKAAPTSVNVTVGQRSREYLTDREVERLIEAAKQNRSGHRDAAAILVAYRHGLRASELAALRWARRCPQPDISAWLPGRAWLRNSRDALTDHAASSTNYGPARASARMVVRRRATRSLVKAVLGCFSRCAVITPVDRLFAAPLRIWRNLPFHEMDKNHLG